MKAYKTLLFDVDETLLDFKAAEKQALSLLFKEQGFPLTEDVKVRYKEINDRLWQAYESGELARDEVVNTRFSLLLKEYGKEADGTRLQESYKSYLEQGHDLIDGAFSLIEKLSNYYDLYVVTNGISSTQYKRLKDSKLYPFFKDIFVSEDTGFQKPMKEYFNYVFKRIQGHNLAQTLIIGDSLSADIKGGLAAGIDTCWFNRDGKHNKGIVPTYEIAKLDELYNLLLTSPSVR
ncbi:HAD family hydrolase [Bacillus endophyticus]|uniref:YjjG family noncanonical pyrimidine nucleotidase n=1 Tax=Priestia endophytica TaxID=135735 RepID=UPI0018CEA32D|nr:YjjG family noncanonical pyrimidine nucleotidase [Priestia endophytica]MBG9812244.1 HAD family hydrolase [Priestia endophytica]